MEVSRPKNPPEDGDNEEAKDLMEEDEDLK